MTSKRNAITTPQKGKRTKYTPKTSTFQVPRNVGRVHTGFPKQLRIVHRYSEFITLTCGLTSSAVYNSWLCNGMYDPNTAVGGHQPMYYDQLSALYQHSCVTSSKITIQANLAAASTATALDNAIVGIVIDDDSTPAVIVGTTLDELPGSIHTQIGNDDQRTLTKYWSAKSAFGVGFPAVMANTELKAGSTGNPQETQAFVIYAYSPDYNPAVVRIKVDIEYTAVWDELRNPGGS